MLSLNRGIAALLMAGLLCSCSGQQSKAGADLIDASRIQTVTANYQLVSPQAADLTAAATANGFAVLPVKTKLFFKEAGASVKFDAALNGFVNKGDLLAELSFNQDEVQTNIGLTKISIEKENTDYTASTNNYEDSLAAAKAGLDAETDNVSRQIDALRIQQMERDHERDAESHDAAIKSLSGDLDKYQAMTQPEQLLAPFDGFIDYTAAKLPGDPVAAGEVMFEICDTSVYQLVFSGKADNFCYNMPVQLELRDKDHTKMDGIIVSDNADVDDSGKSEFVVQTTEKVPDLKSVMQIGFSGGFSVTADSLSVSGALTIPAAALQKDEDKYFVSLYEDGVVKKRYVKIGAQNNDNVQILDGLTTASQVILNY